MREKQKQEELKRELQKVKLRRLVSGQNVCYYDTVLVCICGVYIYVHIHVQILSLHVSKGIVAGRYHILTLEITNQLQNQHSLPRGLIIECAERFTQSVQCVFLCLTVVPSFSLGPCSMAQFYTAFLLTHICILCALHCANLLLHLAQPGLLRGVYRKPGIFQSVPVAVYNVNEQVWCYSLVHFLYSLQGLGLGNICESMRV